MRLVSQQDTFDDFRDFKKLSAKVIHSPTTTKHPCKEMVSNKQLASSAKMILLS